LPKTFAKTGSNGVLTFSLTIFAAVCMVILFFAQQFEKILTFSIFLDCFGMILSSGTVFWFRRKTRHLDGTGIYKMKLFPLFPIIFMSAYLFVGASIFISDPAAALTGLGLLGAFVIIYFLAHQYQKRS
jgi:APA family basic amino acid/polyamine antiporter